MNSLNILSARVSPPQTPAPSRSNSYGNILSSVTGAETRKTSQGRTTSEQDGDIEDTESTGIGFADEKTPLLLKGDITSLKSKPSWQISSALFDSLRWILSTLAAPGVYLLACLYDDTGKFAPLSQISKIQNILMGSAGGKSAVQGTGVLNTNQKGGRLSDKKNEKASSGRRNSKKTSRAFSSSSSSGLSSESESDHMRAVGGTEQLNPGRRTRSKSLQNDEGAPTRRSIRIKLHNEPDTLRQRKHRSTQSLSPDPDGSDTISASEISPSTLKSPTSPTTSLLMTKYPRSPAPPRPLIPRRQPSYSLSDPFKGPMAQKTLILDLDETLIHSMAKGGRMGTGHMVEVKLNTIVGTGGAAGIGQQHPILYYVHKRPFCDEFLRRVCKWYNLVVFTASVQEYADPVIDWLEQERKFFSRRYYRQHCTYRHGAFIKDLSSVEPDLSKVMILDNSPLSYMFHQDNAIPIEGWISDPTDNDLLHLVPLLEGLQYVTDVRAFLALRGGEDGRHMVA